jgi:tight adherence protein B
VNPAVSAVLAAAAAGTGVHLLWTARRRPTVRRIDRPRRRSVADWLTQAGLADVAIGEFAGVVAVLAIAAGAGAYALFGGVVPAILTAAFAATFPVASYRRRRTVRLARAQESWPRLIEEIRILTGSLGRSIPQALFDVGRRAPVELQPAFAAAQREWLLSTDFDRAVHVLKSRLADPTADAACETLLVAHELGGADLDRRLAALAEDRIMDTQGRKDARSRQAGVRFARRFVLVVPAGMALAGMSVGNGRSAYGTGLGQVLVVVALAMTAACWAWAGAIMRLPDEQRVFTE